MRKKLVAVLLCGMLALSLAVPALAALYSGMVVPDDYTGHQFSPNLPITRYQIA